MANKYEFDVHVPSELSAGIRGYSDTIKLYLESGDPGGEPKEFEKFLIESLEQWYDGGKVILVENRCEKCGQSVPVNILICEECKWNNPPFTAKQLEYLKITKKQAAQILKLEENYRAFDYALPQNWLDFFHNRFGWLQTMSYDLILSTTFWAYPKDASFGIPISICTEVQERIKELYPYWYSKNE